MSAGVLPSTGYVSVRRLSCSCTGIGGSVCTGAAGGAAGSTAGGADAGACCDCGWAAGPLGAEMNSEPGVRLAQAPRPTVQTTLSKNAPKNRDVLGDRDRREDPLNAPGRHRPYKAV